MNDSVIVFFPYPKFSWEDAYQWTKEREFFNSKATILTNPNHWDREDMIKKGGLLGEKWFAWVFYKNL